MPAQYEWIRDVFQINSTATKGSASTLSPIYVPSGYSVQRLIVTGSAWAVNNDGWSPLDGNPAYASELMTFAVQFLPAVAEPYEMLYDVGQMCPPNVEAHNGLSHVFASVTYCPPWDFISFDAEVRRRAVSDETRFQLQLNMSPSSTQDQNDYAKELHGWLHYQMLLSRVVA